MRRRNDGSYGIDRSYRPLQRSPPSTVASRRPPAKKRLHRWYVQKIFSRLYRTRFICLAVDPIAMERVIFCTPRPCCIIRRKLAHYFRYYFHPFSSSSFPGPPRKQPRYPTPQGNGCKQRGLPRDRAAVSLIKIDRSSGQNCGGIFYRTSPNISRAYASRRKSEATGCEAKMFKLDGAW